MENIVSVWNGHTRHDFDYHGHHVTIVLPQNPKKDNPWYWRAEFFDAFPMVDIALLNKGYYVVHISVSDQYGSSHAIDTMHNFYRFITVEYNLGARPVLVGLSRGGLYACNYALKYPDCVGCLYLDAPVLDIASWPGGKGTGPGAKQEWEQCMACYGITDDAVHARRDTPIHNLDRLFDTGIPIIGVVGLADSVVPFVENMQVLIDHFAAKGRKVPCIIKSNCDHHPHSLDDPEPVVDFILQNTL